MIQATNIISIHSPRPPSGVVIEADETISITPPPTESKIPRDTLNKSSVTADAAVRDGMRGANRSHSSSYGEDLQRSRPPEAAAPAARALVQSVPSCELVINGKHTGQRIAGCILEAAFQCDLGYLIFLTEDCPFEESLDIHLISLTGTLLDSARIGGMYTTGTFSNIQIHQPDTLFFDFMDKTAHKTGTTWIIKILPRPTARIPFLYGILGISRPFKLKQYFSVKFAPRTEPR